MERRRLRRRDLAHVAGDDVEIRDRLLGHLEVHAAVVVLVDLELEDREEVDRRS
jgi:hypothetical protein